MNTVEAWDMIAAARVRGDLLTVALLEKALTGELSYATYCVLPTPTYTAVDKLTSAEAMEWIERGKTTPQ